MPAAPPGRARRLLRSLQELRGRVSDRWEMLSGRLDPLTPPRHLAASVGGSFESVGQEYLRYLVDLCGLQPQHALLDVGCGVGRIAVPLTRYLEPPGRYEGFDIMPRAIRWCQRQISPRYPHFRFHLADVRNAAYHPRGRHSACEYRFPYPDGTFQVVLLSSVCTHLLPEAVEHYLQESTRVLAPGGRCLATYFLLNEESLALMAEGKAALDFRHQHGHYRTTRDPHEAAVAYDEAYVSNLYHICGLQMRPPGYGSWCGRRHFLSYQDMLVAEKA